MNDNEQRMWEALRLEHAGRHADALALLEELRAEASDVQSKCIFLLNERRCLTAMGEHDRARQRLRMVEDIDAAGEFRLETELGRIEDFHAREQYVQANRQAKTVIERYSTELAQPQNVDVAWELSFSLARSLICMREFEAGLQALPEPLPTAQPEDLRRIQYCRALALRHLKREEEAINEYRKIVAADEPDKWVADAHYDLGMIYGSKKSFAWAKQHLQAAELMKDLLAVPISSLYEALATTCKSLREPDEADRYARLAKSINP